MVDILDGKAIARTIRDKVAVRVANLGTRPGLAVVLVGDDPASHKYVELKKIACEEAGIGFELCLYDAEVEEQVIIDKVREFNGREDVTGILVQLPLPNQDAGNVIPEIDPLKDVDGFHRENVEKLKRGEFSIISATALGVMKLIQVAALGKEFPKTATIVSSPLFAEPLEIMLKQEKAEVIVTQAEDSKLVEKTRNADVIIVAEGMPGLIKAEHVKPGAIVIDVGTTKRNEILEGDVDFESVKPVASALTPVPGGVGPMTVAMLLVNILKAYSLQNG
jgi:methylenetetrahydrofolate dehydrogenase (NADP+) / methenyltetrahydrofolate cyclohydrolase